MRGTGDSSYAWAAYPCVYPGVWRCLQECKDGSPLSITNNIVKLFDWLPAENSCKIRHYEKNFPFFRIPNVFRNDLHK